MLSKIIIFSLGLTVGGLIWPAYSDLLPVDLSGAIQSQPTDRVDGYTLWRRISIDVCQRLPSLPEVDCIESAGGTIPSSTSAACSVNFPAVLRDCLRSEAFAESVGEWAGTAFVQPSATFSNLNLLSRYFHISPTAFPVLQPDGSTERRRAELRFGKDRLVYWGQSWNDCIAPDKMVRTRDVVSGSLKFRTLSKWLETQDVILSTVQDVRAFGLVPVVDPYWKNGFNIKPTPNFQPGIDFNGDGIMDAVYNYPAAGLYPSVTNQVTAADPHLVFTCPTFRELPLGDTCGDGLIDCELASPIYEKRVRGVLVGEAASPATLGNDPTRGRKRSEWQNDEAPKRLVKAIVLGAPGESFESHAFWQIFSTKKTVRTSRLQRIRQETQDRWLVSAGWHPGCDDRILGGYGEMTPGQCDGKVPTNPDIPFRDDYAADELDKADWQVVEHNSEVEYELYSGLLTDWSLLNSQPSQPNYMHQLYKFWLCGEVSWKPYGHSVQIDPLVSPDRYIKMQIPVTSSVDDVNFDLLDKQDAANLALHQSDCQGCHTVVNSMSSLRNRWDSSGSYRPAIREEGVFQGRQAEGIRDLGTKMAGSLAVQACTVNRVAEQLTGKLLPVQSSSLNTLFQTYRENGDYDIREVYLKMLALPEYRRGM